MKYLLPSFSPFWLVPFYWQCRRPLSNVAILSFKKSNPIIRKSALLCSRNNALSGYCSKMDDAGPWILNNEYVPESLQFLTYEQSRRGFVQPFYLSGYLASGYNFERDDTLSLVLICRFSSSSPLFLPERNSFPLCWREGREMWLRLGVQEDAGRRAT